MNEIIMIFDALTGESTERELTAEEMADFETMQNEANLQKIEQDAKAKARASALAKLADLGLTAEEIAAL